MFTKKNKHVSNFRTSFESQTSADSILTAYQDGGGEPSWEVKSLTNLRGLVLSKDSKINLRTVPKMTQLHFITLWKTVFDIIKTKPEDQVSVCNLYKYFVRLLCYWKILFFRWIIKRFNCIYKTLLEGFSVYLTLNFLKNVF